jgi:hypothetical protein
MEQCRYADCPVYRRIGRRSARYRIYLYPLLADDTPWMYSQAPAALFGAGKALLESSLHFDVLDARMATDGFRLVILAENRDLWPQKLEQLERFVSAGGKLLIPGTQLWEDEQLRPILEKLCGVKYNGTDTATGHYMEAVGDFAADSVPGMPLYLYQPFVKLVPQAGSNILGCIRSTYEGLDFPRKYSHFHAPWGELTPFPSAFSAPYGKGYVAVVATNVYSEFYKTQITHFSQPSSCLEVSLMQNDTWWVVHLIQFAANRYTRETVMEDIPPRYHLELLIRPDFRTASVIWAPSGETLPWSETNGVIHVTVPRLDIHGMVVLEK